MPNKNKKSAFGKLLAGLGKIKLYLKEKYRIQIYTKVYTKVYKTHKAHPSTQKHKLV